MGCWSPSRAVALSRCRAVALTLLTSSCFSAGLAAQNATPDPTFEGGYPAADGGGCSNSGFAGKLGAERVAIGHGFDQHDQYRGADVAVPPPAFAAIPAAGNADGTVNVAGDLIYKVELPNPPSRSGYPFDFSLFYRSNRGESAAQGLPDDWNFSFVDRVVVSYSNGTPSSLAWTSGTGDVRQNNGSGSQDQTGLWFTVSRGFSRFRFWSDEEENLHLERYRPDGSVMRYEARPNTNGTVWRPKTFYDPYDNAWTYSYDGNHRLEKVVDPRGVEVRFAWGSSDLVIDYATNSQASASLTYTLTFNSNRVTRFQQHATSYLPSLTGTLYSLSLSSDARYFDFGYDGNGNLNEVADSRGGIVLANTYTSYAGKCRVSAQTDVYGNSHSFTYSLDSGTGVLTTTYTDPLGNAYRFLTGQSGTPHEYRITPNSTTGKPRAAASDTPAEPASLTWTFTSSSCGCGLITQVTYPSGLQYDMGYDGLGNLTSWSTLSPSGSGTVTYTWSYHGLDRGSRPISYTPPSGSNAASISYGYGSTWTSRSSDLWGEKPSVVAVITSTISSPGGGSSHTVGISQVLDSTGRVTQVADPGGTVFTYVYKSSGSGAGLLERIERTPITGDGTRKVEFVVDDFGRLSEMRSGTSGNLLVTTFQNDVLGRTVSASTDPGQGQPVMEIEYYRDAYENLAVVRRSNKDFGGTAPKYDDGSGNGRSWVRKEWHYFYGQLLESYLDRRALPEGEDLQSPTGGSNPWMVRYEFEHDGNGRRTGVTLPNGTAHAMVFDGYGTLYKVISDSAGQSPVELAKAYFDNDLMLAEVRRKTFTNSQTTWASTTLHRNHSGKGVVYKVVGPDGVRTENAFDLVGRVVDSSTFDSGSSRKERHATVYDELGRVCKSARHLLDGSGGTVGSAETVWIYDVRSNVLSVTDPMGRKVHRTYDGYGRLLTVHDDLNTSASQRNEVVLSYVSGRDLVATAVKKLFEESDNSSPPSGTQKSYHTDYVHDLLGRVVERRELGLGGNQTALVHSYGYNSLGMLTWYQSPEQQAAARSTRARCSTPTAAGSSS